MHQNKRYTTAETLILAASAGQTLTEYALILAACCVIGLIFWRAVTLRPHAYVAPATVTSDFELGFAAGDSAARTDLADLLNDCYQDVRDDGEDARPDGQIATADELYSCVATK